MKCRQTNTPATDTSTRPAAGNVKSTGIGISSINAVQKMQQEEPSQETSSDARHESAPFVLQRRDKTPAVSGDSEPAVTRWQPTASSVLQLQRGEGNYRMRTGGNLRQNNNNYTVIRRVPENEIVQVIPKGARVSNFKAGVLTNEHSWVRTNRGEEGWIEDGKLVAVPQAPGQPALQQPQAPASGHDASAAAAAPAPAPQPARVNRLVPGLKLPPKKPEWNYGKDEEGERRYGEIQRIIETLEELQQYQNSHLVLNPAPYAFQAAKKEFSSDYHRAGDEAVQKYYAEAQAAGYNLNDAEVRKLLDVAVALLHSHYYQSMVTTTGILLA